MNHEEHDDLWELLGKARLAKHSPFFSRNVLRAVREEKPERVGFRGWFFSRWTALVVGCGAVVIAAFVLVPKPQQPVDPVAVLAEHVSASPDYAVISNLDELLAAEESSVWLDHSVY
jgi:hypothetical protein